MTPLHFDSHTVPLDQRDKFWREIVQRVFRVDADTTSVSPQPLKTTVDKYDFGDLSVVVVKGSAQRVWVRDWTNADAVSFLLSQTPDSFIEFEGSRHALMPGRAYVIFAHGPVLIQVPDRFEHISIKLAVTSSELSRMVIKPCESGALLLSGGVAATLVSTLLTLLANAPQIAVSAAPVVARPIGELLRAALIETLGARVNAAQRLDTYHRDRIRQHALARLGDPDLSVESIAVAIGLSTRRIHQLFSNSDMTLMRWVWSERLAMCHSRLVDSMKPAPRIGDVAYEWGFTDPAHFSRVFRERYGATPRQHVRLSRVNAS